MHKGQKIIKNLKGCITSWLRKNYIGIVVIFIATSIFFWPIIIRVSSYSEGGDAMFNAWTLARNHHCILRENCDSYADANIYFPNKSTFYYSETQTSTGLLTLPLYLINQNPIFAYNVWTILSFFFAGVFMYFLAKYLSKGREAVSVLTGLIFAFAPFKMSAVSHLQSLSNFYLPLIILLTLLYFEKPKKKYIIGLFGLLVLQFYASWYNMAFVLLGLGVLLVVSRLMKLIGSRTFIVTSSVIGLAGLSTAPLANGYLKFSKTQNAVFSIREIVDNSASLQDYIIPHNGTMLGRIYYHIDTRFPINAWNLDSFSYHGISLYIIAIVVIVLAYKARKRNKQNYTDYKRVVAIAIAGTAGFIMSLGPLLKVQGNFAYSDIAGIYRFVILLPYGLALKLLPQLAFIRALGRASVIFLLTLCCLLAIGSVYLANSKLSSQKKRYIQLAVLGLLIIELMPIHRVVMSSNQYSYNLEIPAVYSHIRTNEEIDNIIIINADKDYPGASIPIARAEQVLWAGYHNRNIYNGYSGYTPPKYFEDYLDYADFHQDDVQKMKDRGLKYIVLDKQLSSSVPDLRTRISIVLGAALYEDDRYIIFKL